MLLICVKQLFYSIFFSGETKATLETIKPIQLLLRVV